MSSDFYTSPIKPFAHASLDPPGEGLNGVAGLALLIGAVAAVAAGATLWLLLTDPVTFAHSLEAGEITPLVRRLAVVLYRAVAALLAYL
jgi:hypothetical protein